MSGPHLAGVGEFRGPEFALTAPLALPRPFLQQVNLA